MNTTPPPRKDLHLAFKEADPATHIDIWNDIWKRQETIWDRGTPSPALTDLLDDPQDKLPLAAGKRLRALVPGCGSGYDVMLLASHGYDSVGVDASVEAVKRAQELCETCRSNAPETYSVKNPSLGRGNMQVVSGDFFDDEWWTRVSQGTTLQKFDLVYDYTFFCALPIALRPRWSARMVDLLAPEGRLICLEFPTYKDPLAPGPPWASRPVDYVAYLSKPSQPVERGADGFVRGVNEDDPERAPDGLVRVAHWQPERTHEIGKDTDWMSVWRHA